MITKRSILSAIKDIKSVIVDYERVVAENLLEENRVFAQERVLRLNEKIAGLELLLPTAVGEEETDGRFYTRSKNLGNTQKKVLLHLYFHGESCRNDISEALGKKPYDCYEAIISLRVRGLITTTALKVEQRGIAVPMLVKLTDEGKIKAKSFDRKDRL